MKHKYIYQDNLYCICEIRTIFKNIIFCWFCKKSIHINCFQEKVNVPICMDCILESNNIIYSPKVTLLPLVELYNKVSYPFYLDQKYFKKDYFLCIRSLRLNIGEDKV